MLLYHFTSRLHLPSIQGEGVIRTTDPNLFAAGGPVTRLDPETGEVSTTGGPILGQPVVWLLDTRTAEGYDHGLLLNYVVDKRAVRVTVDVPDAVQWQRWVTARRHDARYVGAIVKVGGGVSAARHWFVVPRPIPATEWVEIRDMRTGTVLSLDGR